jgi:hypothetical protein
MSNRNNQDRVGARSNDDAPAVTAAAATPPPIPETKTAQGTGGLNFVVPTEHIELPSEGKFYPEGHPLHKQETIEIRHMTARDEEILTSRTLLKKGIAIDRLLQNVIVDKRVKVSELLVGDKNAILIFSRMLAYGPDYKAKITCPACTSVSDFEFDLRTHKMINPNQHENPESEGFKPLPNGNFAILLPKTEVIAEVRLLTGQDELHLARFAEAKKKKSRHGVVNDSILTEQIRRSIVSLNGETNKFHINNFINNMPATDSRQLRKVYAKITPNIDMKQEFWCPSCGESTDMEVPFTAEFFWPK